MSKGARRRKSRSPNEVVEKNWQRVFGTNQPKAELRPKVGGIERATRGDNSNFKPSK